MPHYGFTITTEVVIVSADGYAEAFSAALELGEQIYTAVDDAAEVVIRATGSETFRGVPHGVYCEGCAGHTVPGVRWPTETNGDNSEGWVERCDTCGRFETDQEAVERIIAEYKDSGARIERGSAIPEGASHAQPFVNVT